MGWGEVFDVSDVVGLLLDLEEMVKYQWGDFVSNLL
jgi:hypothetical protein